jgi:hypothetical protein
VPLSSAKRAWIVIAIVLLCLLGAGLAYYYWKSRPLPPIVSTLPGVPAAGPPPDLLSQLPADAPVVAYIDAVSLRKLQNSPLAAALGLATPGPQADRDYANFVRDTGFDYTRDLDHAAIAAWPASFGTPDNVLGEDRVLAIADGRFDQQKIKAYALRTGKEVPHGPQPVYEVPGNPPVSLTFLSPTRIALAGGRNATDLLARIDINASSSSSRAPAMQSRIQRVAGAPIFAVGRTDRLPPNIYAPLHNSPQLEQIARSVQAITIAGQPDRDNLRITLDAECDAMKNAMQLGFLLETGKMAGSMALSDPRTRRQLTKDQLDFLEALLSHATINPQNKTVRINLMITPDMLNASPAPPKPAASHAPATPHAAAPPTPPADYPHTSQ